MSSETLGEGIVGLTNSVINGVSTLRTEYFDCECHSHDHSIRFAFDPTEEDIRCLDIWVDAHFPNNRTLWQRIVLATKYVLKHSELDQSYGSWILKHEDEPRLKAFFREYDMTIWKLKSKQVKQESYDPAQYVRDTERGNASIKTNGL